MLRMRRFAGGGRRNGDGHPDVAEHLETFRSESAKTLRSLTEGLTENMGMSEFA